jgi:hypothetical protein
VCSRATITKKRIYHGSDEVIARLELD